MSQATTPARSSGPKPFYRNFGFQVLIAMVIGLLLGLVARNIGPDAAGSPNWLSVTF